MNVTYFELRNLEGNDQESKTAPKAKKRRKKKLKEETVERTTDGSKTSETFWFSFNKATEDRLTSLELDDLSVDGNSYYLCTSTIFAAILVAIYPF